MCTSFITGVAIIHCFTVQQKINVTLTVVMDLENGEAVSNHTILTDSYVLCVRWMHVPNLIVVTARSWYV